MCIGKEKEYSCNIFVFPKRLPEVNSSFLAFLLWSDSWTRRNSFSDKFISVFLLIFTQSGETSPRIRFARSKSTEIICRWILLMITWLTLCSDTMYGIRMILLLQLRLQKCHFMIRETYFSALQLFQDRQVLSPILVSICVRGEHYTLPVSQDSGFNIFLY